MLDAWISARHLRASSGDVRAALAEARPVALDDFLLPQRLADLRGVYAETGWEDMYGLRRAADHEVDLETFRAAPDGQRLFHYEEFLRPAQGRELATSLLTSVRLRMVFGAPDFMGWLAELTGLSLGDSHRGRLRRMRPGHYLRSHSDETLERTFCMVLYLHDRWTEGFGSSFEMVAGQTVTRVDPMPARLLLFRPLPGTAHQVLPFGPQANGWERRSLSHWYAAPD